MLRHKNINKICWAAASFAVVLAILFTVAASSGWLEAKSIVGYENRLFDTSRVHTIDIVMDDWDSFIQTATAEEYSSCTIVVDGEKYSNVGIRAKGNSSLSSVAAYGNDRYSLKVEFDQYRSGSSYYGLDKISLNNLIYDSTYMKDYLTYQMMNHVGVTSPLSSFVYITVNGEEWGLYLAVEGIEEGFLQRNYGTDYGTLYKPDSMNMGGGRGAGAGFNMDDFMNGNGFPEGFAPRNMPEGFDPSPMFSENGNENNPGRFGRMGSGDVSLQYIDDNPSSYPNIFDNAKTDITNTDKSRLIASLKQLNEGKSLEDVVDIEAVIKYFVVHNFVQNGDSYTGMMVHNYYLYEENGVLSMLPWDYNMAFGGFGGMGMRQFGGSSTSNGATSDVNAPIDSPVTGGTLESRPMVAWIFESEEYTALYHQYFAEYITSYFDSGYFEQMLDEAVNLISPYVEKDPTAFCTYEEFKAGIETLREFCLLRAESISGQLKGTIPSTQEGQGVDSTALVDASHISIANMGSMMGGGFGAFRNGIPGMGERPSSDTPSSENASSNENSTNQAENEPSPVPDGSQNQPGRGGMPDGNFDMRALPEGFDPSSMFGASQPTGGTSPTTQLALLVGSLLFLALGLIIAKRYK